MAISGSIDLEQHVRILFRLLFAERDFAAAQAHWAPDLVEELLALDKTVRGAGEARRFFEGLFAAVPDFTMDIEDVHAAGDTAVIQWRGTGHHTGAPWEGIAPTGRAIDLRGCDVMVFDGERRLRRNTIYYDGTTFARQVGLLPAKDSPADRGLLAAFNARVRLRARLKR